MSRISTFNSPPYQHDQNLLLPRLRSLTFGERSRIYRLFRLDGDEILPYLSLPALETLIVPLHRMSTSDFSVCLKQSPSLQTLILGEGRYTFVESEKWLRPVPCPRHLEMDMYTSDVSFLPDLYSSLAESPSDFLPNLHTLKSCTGPLRQGGARHFRCCFVRFQLVVRKSFALNKEMQEGI